MKTVFFEGYGKWLYWEPGLGSACIVKEEYKARGVFQLTKYDEAGVIFKNNSKLLGIHYLEPCTHELDAFSMAEEQCQLAPKENCYFEINLDKEFTLKLTEKSKSNEENTSALKQKLNSLQKLVICMALDKYNYNPSADKNKASGAKNESIKASLQKYGLDKDEETILTHLEEAVKVLPSEIKERLEK